MAFPTFGPTAIILLVTVFEWMSVANACRWVRKGTTYTIDKSAKKLDNDRFIWKKEATNGQIGEVVVLECDTHNIPVQCTSPLDPDNYSGMLYYRDGFYRPSLTIGSVNRFEHETIWSWYDGAVKLGSCGKMVVYEMNNPMTCDAIHLSDDNTAIEWTCQVEQMYPDAWRCSFNYNIGVHRELIFREPAFPINAELKQTAYGNPVYYNATCSLTVPISFLDPGEYIFQLRNMLTQNLGYDKVSKKLILVLPQPKFRDCPPGTDLTGTNNATHTCQCVLTGEGFPPSHSVQWFDAQNSAVGQDLGIGSSLLTFRYDQGQNRYAPYTCRAESSFGTTDIVYHPSPTSYAAKLAQFRVNSKIGLVEVRNGSNVEFSCVAEGNPLPHVTVIGKWTKRRLPIQITKMNDFSVEASISDWFRCEDSEIYTCQIDNGIGDLKTKDVSVFVLCRLAIVGVVNHTQGDNIMIELEVTGYPEPNFMYVVTSTRIRGDFEQLAQQYYTTQFVPSSHNRGTVVLTMSNYVKADLYTLKVSSTNGNVEYQFYAGSGNGTDWDWEDGGNGADLDLRSPTAVAIICLGCGLVMCVITFFVGMQVGVRKERERMDDARNSQPEEDQTEANPSTVESQLEDCDYEIMDHDYTNNSHIPMAGDRSQDYLAPHQNEFPPTGLDRTGGLNGIETVSDAPGVNNNIFGDSDSSGIYRSLFDGSYVSGYAGGVSPLLAENQPPTRIGGPNNGTGRRIDVLPAEYMELNVLQLQASPDTDDHITDEYAYPESGSDGPNNNGGNGHSDPENDYLQPR